MRSLKFMIHFKNNISPFARSLSKDTNNIILKHNAKKNPLCDQNKKRGFTLIEVLIALAILGATLTPLILNQSRFLSRTHMQSNILDRTFAGLHFMVDSFAKFEQNNKFRTAKKIIESPETTLKFSITQPKTALKKEFKNLFKQEVSLEWDGDGKKQQDNLVTFVFLPDVEEK